MPCVRRLVLGPLLVAAASSTLASADPPTVAVVQAELRGVGLLEQTFAVALCVTNPNGAEFAFQRVRIAVDLAGTPLAESKSEVAVRLPGRTSTLVPFAVTTTIRNLGPLLLSVIRIGSLDYRMHGTVQLAGALPLSLPFSRSGHLGLISAGRDLLADAAAPAGSNCGAIFKPVSSQRLRQE